jgi:4-amino-4-deoxychorismate lyase
MFPLFETIRIVDGEVLHLDYHHNRMNRSRRLLFGRTDPLDLRGMIQPPAAKGTFRCRVIYGADITAIECTPYQKRPVRSLALVTANDIDYSHKYLDRSSLDALRRGIAADDVLIVRENRITDTSFANIVFTDGHRLVTPVVPLLAGTARARLLAEGVLAEQEITVNDLRRYSGAAIINAMVDLDLTFPIPISSIT